MIKTVVFLVTAILQIFSIKAQKISEDESAFLNRYFTWSLMKRYVYLSEELGKGGIPVSEFATLSKDFESLVGLNISKSGATSIGGVLGVVYINNDSVFNIFLDSLKLLINERIYLRYEKTKCTLSPTDTSEYLIFRAYLRNSPIHRMTFIEENLFNIPEKWIGLFKCDLDHIFEVTTENFNDNKHAFKRAKKKWIAASKRLAKQYKE